MDDLESDLGRPREGGDGQQPPEVAGPGSRRHGTNLGAGDSCEIDRKATIMKCFGTLKYVAVSITIFGATAAYGAHWDRPSCYIDVHSACTAEPPCSPKDYNDFLDNCDATYPSAGGAKRLKYNNALAPNQQTINSSAYKKKIRNLTKSTKNK